MSLIAKSFGEIIALSLIIYFPCVCVGVQRIQSQLGLGARQQPAAVCECLAAHLNAIYSGKCHRFSCYFFLVWSDQAYTDYSDSVARRMGFIPLPLAVLVRFHILSQRARNMCGKKGALLSALSIKVTPAYCVSSWMR